MALTTLLGTAQLALQDALGRSLSVTGGIPRVGNFAVVSLRRDTFQAQNAGRLAEERARFRRDLIDGISSFLHANGWRVGGTGSLVVNVVLRSIAQDCAVQVRTVDALYELEIADDGGERVVPVKVVHATVGRAHDAHPRGFVELHDSSRLVSREHLRLDYADLAVTARLLGRNPTAFNGQPMSVDPIALAEGDVIECGRCRIRMGKRA